VYGANASSVTCTLADQTSGSTKFTNDATMNVAAFSIDPAATVTGYLIAEYGDMPLIDDTRWAATQPATFTIDPAPAENSFVTLVGWVKTHAGAIVPGAPQTIYYSAADWQEIPKNTMTVSAPVVEGTGPNMIDNNTSSFGRCNNGDSIIVKFSKRYRVGFLTCIGRNSYQDRIGGCQIYITDDPSNPGEVVASGTFANTFTLQDAPITADNTGFYLIIKTVSPFYRSAGVAELWIYGTPAPAVTSFKVSDQYTGGSKFTSSPTVNVDSFVFDDAGQSVTHFMITGAGDVPSELDPRWSEVMPSDCTITPEPEENSYNTLVAWIKTDTGAIAPSAPVSIFFTSMPLVEIPRTGTGKMIPTASKVAEGGVNNILDNNPGSFFQTNTNANEWIQLQFTARWKVGFLTYQGRQAYSDIIRDYEIYIEDAPVSGPTPDWSAMTPVITGTFANTVGTQDVIMTTGPKEGAYLIIRAKNAYRNIGCAEIWVYGTTVPSITNFRIADQTTSSQKFINSDTVSVVAFEVNPEDQVVTHYMVALAGDVPYADDARWQTVVPEAHTVVPAPEEGDFIDFVGWIKTNLGLMIPSAPHRVYYTELPLEQVSKSAIIPTASKVAEGSITSILDNNENSFFQTNSPGPEWIQLQLPRRYRVGYLEYQGRQAYGDVIKDYQIYLTDDPANWGDPVATGMFTDSSVHAVPIPFGADGSYVIINGLNAYRNIGCAEVWVYGVPMPAVTAFKVADADTGSQQFINSATVNVATFDVDPLDQTVTGYMITLAGDAPALDDARWQVEQPSEFTIDPAPEENSYVNLVGWIKTDAGMTAPSAPHTVFYSSTPFSLIPKGTMVATASNLAEGLERNVVDGTNGMWNGGPGPQWMRVQFAHRQNVLFFTYQGRVDHPNGRTLSYELYVTDDPNVWGEPVAAGTWLDNASLQDVVPTPKEGRYLILKALTGNPNTGVGELWIYGAPVLDVTDFAVADALTVSAKFVTTQSVDVTAFTPDAGEAVVNGYMITEGSTVPDAADPGWSIDPPAAYAISHPAAAVGEFLSLRGWIRTDSGDVAPSAPQVIYYSTTPWQEIPKNTMTVSASATPPAPAPTIDGNINSVWNISGTNVYPQWVRFDLGEATPWTLGMFSFIQRQDHHNGRVKDYNLYVTNDPDTWGTPVISSEFAVTNLVQDIVVPPTPGRYVVLEVTTHAMTPNELILPEVWLYGAVPPSGPTITAFTVADQSTGSELFTNSASVNVAIEASPVDPETPVVACMVTETDAAPDAGNAAWAASVTTYTITGGEGHATLYAWAKDAAEQVGGGLSTTIYFSTATPVVTNIAVADNGNGTATATWTTDIPAEGSVKYGPVSMTGSTPNTAPENALRSSHQVTFATAAGVNCKIILVNNEIASPAFYWPLAWPIDGDSNMDCRVNILDLIFIRNKLNQDVATGDNWKADVNNDLRINILDLIYVRNKLNTSCP